MRETSIASSPSSLYSNTEIDYGFYNSLMAKTLTKYMQLDFAEEMYMLTWMTAVVASI
jgi:hypothetical protein